MSRSTSSSRSVRAGISPSALSPKGPPDGSGMADRLRTDITPHPEEPSLARLLGNERPGPGRAAVARGDRRPGATGCGPDRARSGIAEASSTTTARTGRTTRNSSSRSSARSTSRTAGAIARSSIRRTRPPLHRLLAAGARRPASEDMSPPAAWPLIDGVEPGPRAERHRQRVATLAMWRQTAIARARRGHRHRPRASSRIGSFEIGHEAARLIGMIPGVSLSLWAHRLVRGAR